MIRSYKTELFRATCFSLLVLFLSWILSLYRGRPRIVFCNVGQGNGVYIRTHEKKNIIIDAGPPNNAMLVCLGREMPLFEKKIDIAVLSHMQSDHVGGFPEIAKRYDIQNIYAPSAKLPKEIKNVIMNQPATITVVRKNDVLQVGENERIEILWPPLSPDMTKKSLDLNMFALIVTVCVYNRCSLLPSDAPYETLEKSVTLPHRIMVLEISHHGSQNGTSAQLLRLVQPSQAVVSVGKNNYGHPSKKVIDFLEKFQIPYKRTDVDGDISIAL